MYIFTYLSIYFLMLIYSLFTFRWKEAIRCHSKLSGDFALKSVYYNDNKLIKSDMADLRRIIPKWDKLHTLRLDQTMIDKNLQLKVLLAKHPSLKRIIIKGKKCYFFLNFWFDKYFKVFSLNLSRSTILYNQT